MIAFDQRLESRQNDVFRQLQRLLESSRERRKTQRNVIEGVHLLQAFWDSLTNVGEGPTGGARLHQIFVAQAGSSAEVVALITRITVATTDWSPALRPRIIGLAEPLFRQVSQVENGNGPLAVIDTPRPPLPARLVGDMLFLDRVQDPGNTGSILRTAAAAGIAQVVLSPTAAFCWAPKVLRAAMGAHFALRIYEGVAWEELSAARIDGQRLRALVAPAQARSAGIAMSCTDLHQTDLRAATLWLCGHEGQGLAQAILADDRVTGVSIDQAAQVESMNVAAALAVALFEQRRQRALIPVSA